ncbi:MAG TPA: hypothetical protein VNR17_10090 [Luteimicrobium sp.]|nr:hypothetical protein [Luteimicrobium sp.]
MPHYEVIVTRGADCPVLVDVELGVVFSEQARIEVADGAGGARWSGPVYAAADGLPPGAWPATLLYE